MRLLSTHRKVHYAVVPLSQSQKSLIKLKKNVSAVTKLFLGLEHFNL